MEARLASPTDIMGFRAEARNLLALQVPPDEVTWSMPADGGSITLPWASTDEQARRSPARAASSIVPASFVRLCEYVVQHREADRFALLYRLLWRLVHEPHLRHEPGDPDMARAHHMAHAVRRDIHKCKVHLRFRDVQDPAKPGSPLHVAWCEPAHHVLETVAPWLARRMPATRWVVLTPERSAYWNGKQLRYAATGGGAPLPASATDGDWLARWQALFPERSPN